MAGKHRCTRNTKYTKNVSVRLPWDVYNAVKRQCDHYHMSVSYYVLQALQDRTVELEYASSNPPAINLQEGGTGE